MIARFWAVLGPFAPPTEIFLNTTIGPRTISACRMVVQENLPIAAQALRARAEEAGWNAEGYWGFTPKFADAFAETVRADVDFLDRHGIVFDTANSVGRPCNELSFEHLAGLRAEISGW